MARFRYYVKVLKYERAGPVNNKDYKAEKRIYLWANPMKNCSDPSRIDSSKEDNAELFDAAAAPNYRSDACQPDFGFSSLKLANDPEEYSIAANPFGEGCSTEDRNLRRSQKSSW